MGRGGSISYDMLLAAVRFKAADLSVKTVLKFAVDIQIGKAVFRFDIDRWDIRGSEAAHGKALPVHGYGKLIGSENVRHVAV